MAEIIQAAGNAVQGQAKMEGELQIMPNSCMLFPSFLMGASIIRLKLLWWEAGPSTQAVQAN